MILSNLTGCDDRPTIEAKRYLVDIKFKRCLEQDYLITEGFIGVVGKAKELPLEACDAVVGFTPEDWADIYLVLWNLYQNQDDPILDIQDGDFLLDFEEDEI
jgi:hypothetical protein